ncbi:RNA-binding motif protein, X-linked 2 [Halyomorpha halys]|uniref:RNA-binding motif protein, X-linked 2 n=1 Tax=Halyomorpha halys TaxID=286706 RepID=UPI0006D4D5F2|nr:RNA-binding motif protein, X-linked 2 [Halyomorpha halys]
MNPLTNMKNVKKLSEQELQFSFKTSWHDQYKDSAWIFIGGLPYDLTEGDIICVFSQYGEIVNINLVRDKGNGKSRGFCFLCYEDQKSTILAVDNLNGIKVLGRTIRVDHVADYKTPKENQNFTEETKKLHEEGCAVTFVPKIKTEPVDNYEVDVGKVKTIKKEEKDIKIKKEVKDDVQVKKESEKRKHKEKKSKSKKEKDKKSKRKKRKHQKSDSSSSSSSSESSSSESDSDSSD